MSLERKNNAWIKPSGQFIKIGYMEHNEYAIEYFNEKYGRDKGYEKIEDMIGRFGYPYEALHQLGWIRLLTWTDGKTKALGGTHNPSITDDTVDPSCTNKQKETLLEWCMDNKFNYDKLFIG